MNKKISFVSALLFAACAAANSQTPVKIGVITDLSGPYSGMGGSGSVAAARLAVQDFGGSVLGRPIEIVAGDNLNKPDVGSTIVRRWFDQDGVSAVVDGGSSAVGLAVQVLARDKGKIFLITGSTTSALTGKECSPTGFQWAPDTYSTSGPTAKAIVESGGKSWYFVSADYSFGQATYNDAAAAIKEAGGTVLGNVRHPLGASDFASFLLSAQGSKAEVVAFANASDDLTNSVKQASEMGLDKKQRLVGFFLFFNVINSLGLERAKGLISATPFYWDLNQGTRDWTARFLKTEKVPPTATHAGTYSAVLHYLKAIQAAKTDDGPKVAEMMRHLEINDVFVKSARIREDGRVMIDLLLTQVKKPEDSKYKFDYLSVTSTIPAAEAYRPVNWDECKYIKRP